MLQVLYICIHTQDLKNILQSDKQLKCFIIVVMLYTHCAFNVCSFKILLTYQKSLKIISLLKPEHK